MKAHDVLRAAHAVILEGGWSAGASARDSAGGIVPLFAGADRAGINPLAVSFSIYGAICKAASGQPQSEPALMWETMARCAKVIAGVPGGSNHLHPVIGINEMEGQTQDGVLAFLAACADELDPPPAAPQLAAPAPMIAIEGPDDYGARAFTSQPDAGETL